MFKQKPFIFSFLVLAILVVLHFAGSYYSLYWQFPWFDILVHIFSGLWISSLILWLASILGQINSLKEYKIKSFLIAVISAILVGVLWELVENFSQVVDINSSVYAWNTALDILSDGLGGILAFLYFTRRKRCADENTCVLHPFYNQTGIVKN